MKVLIIGAFFILACPGRMASEAHVSEGVGYSELRPTAHWNDDRPGGGTGTVSA